VRRQVGQVGRPAIWIFALVGIGAAMARQFFF
jgi:hypothetical protein